ncbi:MAG: cbb3-type cytochrome c oxidase subunit I [Gemmatimonadetes bacterium]|nr:cbb3-type cytochrome c oxidase subunit I [Gemmatimonadota bacterium]
MSGEHAYPGFWRRYVFSTDHKVIGIQYYLTAVFMAVVAVALAILIRLQLAWPHATWPLLGRLLPGGYEEGVLKPEFYLSLVTMHGTIMVFFVISFALVSGFGNFIIPLHIGARDMAYPFLNMLSYWLVVPASVLILASFFVEGGAAAAGWTAYPPLSALPEAVPGSGWGQTLWLLAMALFIVSFTLGSLNFLTTILNLRTRGMSMMRMPLTVWTMLIAAILGLLAFPALTAAAIMLLLDRHGGTSFFLPQGLVLGEKVLSTGGGTPLLFQHLFWFLGHPEVYVLVLPALGIAFDILATFGRRPVFGYRTSVWSLLVIAGLSMIVWGHHMFTSGMNPYLGEYFSVVTVAITVPFAVLGLNLIASLWRAQIRLTTAMLFALGLVSAIGIGGLGGLYLGTAAADIYFHDSYFVVGHFHFTIGTVTFFAIFAGTYYWFPKMFGRHMSETLGKLHFWLTIVPLFAAFIGMHYLGLGGHPRRVYDPTVYEFLRPLQPFNIVISLALILATAAQLVFLFNFLVHLFRGELARSNPWRGATLEWTTSSPAPHLNWVELPVVHRGPYEYRVDGEREGYLPQHSAVVGGAE